MRETDLAKSLPAARCEMDSGTVTGKEQPTGVCRALTLPSMPPPIHRAKGSPPLPPATNTAGHQWWQPQGIQALGGRRFSVQPEGRAAAVQPFRQARRPQAIPDKTGAPSLFISSPLLQQTHSRPGLPLLNRGKSISPQVQSQGLVAFKVFAA